MARVVRWRYISKKGMAMEKDKAAMHAGCMRARRGRVPNVAIAHNGARRVGVCPDTAQRFGYGGGGGTKFAGMCRHVQACALPRANARGWA